MTGEPAPDRALFEIGGKDAIPFLQGMVSNDVLGLAKGPGIVWTALLTPQGKYLVDFFVVNTGAALLLDLPAALAHATIKRLSMYRLRADVMLEPSPLHVTRGLEPIPDGAFADPRHQALGWRRYGPPATTAQAINWDAIRVVHVIPESGIELLPDDSYILEMGFERLHGVDFRKGCYVGQEVTARMKHKTELRKGLARVRIDGTAPVGTEITAGGKTVGRLGTSAGGAALAYLRFDQAKDEMQAGSALILGEIKTGPQNPENPA
jgi:folate-binding protein YgfZ